MISIITPTYNRANLLPRMVNSLINQTSTDWELIIVDDGSTDDTSQIVEDFKDSRIKYFPKANSGATASRNLGVNKAQGDYIIFLDSDDEPKTQWLELLIKKINGQENAIVSCGWEKLNDQKKIIQVSPPQNLGPLFNNITLNYLAGSLLIKKDYFLEIEGFDINLQSGHHTDLLLRLLPVFEKYNVTIGNIPESLLKIHSHSGTKIRSNNSSVYYGTLALLKKHHLKFEKNRKEHIDYLSVAALNALKMGKEDEGKKLLRKAFLLGPFNGKSLVRVILAQFPFLRNSVWK